eukprot:scaffold3334_cov56-Phaeocystis_antarctica.AAC.2
MLNAEGQADHAAAAAAPPAAAAEAAPPHATRPTAASAAGAAACSAKGPTPSTKAARGFVFFSDRYATQASNSRQADPYQVRASVTSDPNHTCEPCLGQAARGDGRRAHHRLHALRARRHRDRAREGARCTAAGAAAHLPTRDSHAPRQRGVPTACQHGQSALTLQPTAAHAAAHRPWPRGSSF